MKEPEGTKVTLTWSEVMQAAMVGVMRRVTDLRDKRRGAYNIAEDAPVWDIDIEGACGEMAAAKVLNVFWSGAHGQLRVADVGGRFQVRTRSKLTYELPLHPEDADDAVFVLVLGRAPHYNVKGWMYARDGKLPEYWDDPSGQNRPAFFVPRKLLLPLDEIPRQ